MSIAMARLLLLPLPALALIGSAAPETRFDISLPAALGDDASGRLLLFAAPLSADNGRSEDIDIYGPDDARIFVAGRDVASFGTDHTVSIDAQESAFPTGISALAPGDYRVQIVLDRDGDYNYGGRGPGDLVSKVVTLRLPLRARPSIALDHRLPPAPAQFDVTGLPPRAAEQITASRPHLHDEQVVSKALTRFRGTPQSVAAWVLTPPGYDPNGRVTYPTVYTAGAFGTNHRVDGQQLSRIWHLMETKAIPPMIWVTLDFASPTGTTEFADSVNNGPWGEALTREIIPALESRYRMDAKPSGRFLTGHSSGGWFALWAMVRYPAFFGGSWASSPDPVDFRHFIGVDLYQPGANMYRDANGVARPLERARGAVKTTIAQAAGIETVLGRDGGQLRSFDWTFSPRRADGTPAPLFDRVTGAVDAQVAAYWRDNYDIGHRIETQWPRLRHDLEGKVHVVVGTADSYYLDGAVHDLEAAFRKVGGRAEFIYVSGASHSINEVYARDGDRNAYYREMAQAMYAVARPAGATGGR